jgi:hypothetical protein
MQMAAIAIAIAMGEINWATAAMVCESALEEM